MDFKDCLPFEVFAKFEESQFQSKQNGTKKNNYSEEARSIFIPAIKKFFQEKIKNNELVFAPELVGHNINPGSIYNDLVQKKEIEHYKENNFYYNFIHHAAFLSRYYREGEERTPDTIKQKYEDFIHKVNTGNFMNNECFFDKFPCQTCGQNISISFENWKPKVTVFNHELFTFDKPKDCLAKDNLQVEVEFKTQELIALDGIRIKEFQDYTANLEKLSINEAIGRIEMTKAYAQHNMIHLCVGNTSPNIFQRNDSFAVGHYEDCDDEEAGSFTSPGMVCTDRWTVLIVEIQTVIDIVAKTLGQEKAKIKVEEFLNQKPDWTFTYLRVTPGKYTVNFNGDYEQFSEYVKKDKFTDFDEHDKITPFFTFHKSDMKLKQKSKYKI